MDLERLRLSGNRLSGAIPPELSNLGNLTQLAVGGNELTGCVPKRLREIYFNDLSELGLPSC